VNYSQTNPTVTTNEPEIDLILAIYRQARRDIVGGRGRVRQEAELFLRAEGFDVERIKRLWLEKGRAGEEASF
jgi:hypothetical protein